jgi:hypothetical protein
MSHASRQGDASAVADVLDHQLHEDVVWLARVVKNFAARDAARDAAPADPDGRGADHPHRYPLCLVPGEVTVIE